jgi:hypothetical protein
MDDYNYNFEIRTLLTHFAAAFDGVKIKRFDGKKYAKEVVKVPFTYAPKSHIVSDLLGPTDTVRLPIMAVEITGQGRDNDRVKNKIEDLKYRNEDGTYVNLKVVPWNIKVQLTILAKFQEDMDQIIQNFAVNTNPYIIVSWQEPKSGRELRTEILWDGNVSYEYPGKNQGPKDPPFRVTATTSFTIKGYVFKANVENSAPICFINTDYIFTDKFYCNYDTLVSYTSTATTESYAITGRPVLRYVSPYYIVEGQSPTITLQGYSFGDVNGVFVSGSNPMMYPMSTFQPFTALDVFSAYPVDQFSKDDTTITFTLPAPSASGFIDLIAVNTCGYGLLTEDANRCNRVENPYPVDDPNHYTWTVLQFPYLNGLIVADFFDPLCIDYHDRQTIYTEGECDKDAAIQSILQIMSGCNISLAELSAMM